MKKHVVIVGAGFAGLELAARLSESLAEEVRVTLIDRNDAFFFGFSKLCVLLGRRAPSDVLLHYGETFGTHREGTFVDPFGHAGRLGTAHLCPAPVGGAGAHNPAIRSAAASQVMNFTH
jgi:hypothetical protein